MIHVIFDCDDPPTHLVTLLGPDRVDVSSGYGGWQEVERPRRTTVTTWQSQPARRMAISVLIDNWLDDTPGGPHSVEDQIRQLERMALPRPGGEPPVIKVTAAGGVVPPFYEALQWVIEAISWGDGLTNANWNRVRQAAVVTLLEYVSDDLLEKRTSPAKKQRSKRARKTGKNRKKGARNKRAASKGKRKPRARAGLRAASAVYDGEDLLSVAARELGDARRWIEIAQLSGIRDPRAVKRGQIIRLP